MPNFFDTLTGTTRWQIVSPETPEECSERLTTIIDAERFRVRGSSSGDHMRPVIGSATLVSIHLRKRTPHQNAFQTHLSATIVPHGDGCVIAGHCGIKHAILVFLFVWFGVLAFAAVGAVLKAAATPSSVGVTLPPIIMLALAGALFARFGRRKARGESEYLMNFLADTVDGRLLVRR